MVSIIIPIHNAKDYLEQTIQSVFVTTDSKFELILIDDFSDKETREYVKGIESPEVKIQKVFNTQQYWVNYNWNLGVRLAQGEYIAILNSDIILSKGWDTHLIEILKTRTIACPTNMKENQQGKFLQNLNPTMQKVDPRMINGSCFMLKAVDKDMVFPIPQEIKHWCGDNWIADRANNLAGVEFSRDAKIQHFITRSGVTVPKQKYWARILADMEAYEKISDRSLKLIKKKMGFL